MGLEKKERMIKIENVLNIFKAPVDFLFMGILGDWDVALQLLLTVILLDYITGICKAIYSKKLDSSAGVRGIVKKVGYLIVVAMSQGLDQINRTLIIYFFIANESLSILENWGNMGLPLPKKIFNVFKQLKSENDQKIKEREKKI